MNWVNDILSGIKSRTHDAFYDFDKMDALFIALIVFSSAMLVILAMKLIRFKTRKKRLTVIKKRNYFTARITGMLSRHDFSMKILNSIAVKLCMLNRYSYEKNLENSVIFCVVTAVFLLLSVIVFIPAVSVVWYVTITYILMSGAFAAIAFVIFTFVARLRFTSKLPETYKLLNSRYITSGNILKAINTSMEDFDRVVKREMHKLQNVLKKNNMAEIEETFKRLESTYRNEYMTLLLNLILQAYYKGGDAAIKKQFENTTEEILADIENQKDLSFTARIYMALALFLPLGVKWFEAFNHNALGSKASEFYSSPLGVEIKLLFYFALLFYLGILLFMERTA